MALRTDAVFCMQRLKLSLFDVPCVEDVNFNELSEQHDKGKTRLKIILVDHNNIFDKSLESKCLTEIIDHHQRYKSSFGENVKCTIDMVGSCATLVIDQIWEQDPSFQVKTIKFFNNTNLFLSGDTQITSRHPFYLAE